MPTENTTPNQGYQLPFAGNDLEDDVARIIAAIGAIDTDVASALSTLAAKAGLASPAFTGTPTAPTAAPGTDTAQLATTAFVKAALDALIGGAPGALDTLNELAEAIGDDADYAASMVAALSGKLDKTGGTISGDLIPDADGTRDLGSKTLRFAEVHTDTINGGAISGFKNRLQNPLFQVDIEGNAGGVTTSGKYVVEGWRCNFSNDVTAQTYSRVAGDRVPYALRYTVTTGSDASIAAGQYAITESAIEGYDIADAKWGTAGAKPIWISGRLKAPTTDIYCIGVKNATSTRSYVFEVSCTAGTWVDFEKEIPGDTSGTWDSTNGLGLWISFPIACGSTYQITADTWSAGNYIATANQANGLATNGNIYEIENIRLSVGGPIPTEWRPYAFDLAHCQRYYQTGLIRFDSSVATSANYSASAYLPVVMRSAPTVVWTNVSATTFSATVNALLALPYMVAAYHTSSGAGGANFQDSFTASARMI
jgi:hypothetical protein